MGGGKNRNQRKRTEKKTKTYGHGGLERFLLSGNVNAENTVRRQKHRSRNMRKEKNSSGTMNESSSRTELGNTVLILQMEVSMSSFSAFCYSGDE